MERATRARNDDVNNNNSDDDAKQTRGSADDVADYRNKLNKQSICTMKVGTYRCGWKKILGTSVFITQLFIVCVLLVEGSSGGGTQSNWIGFRTKASPRGHTIIGDWTMERVGKMEISFSLTMVKVKIYAVHVRQITNKLVQI